MRPFLKLAIELQREKALWREEEEKRAVAAVLIPAALGAAGMLTAEKTYKDWKNGRMMRIQSQGMSM